MSKDSRGIDFDNLSISGKVVRLASLDEFDRDAALDIEQQIARTIQGIEMAYRQHQDDVQRGRDYAGLYQEVSAAERAQWPGAYRPDILTEHARYDLLGEDYVSYVKGADDRYEAYLEGMAKSCGVTVDELDDEQISRAKRVAGIVDVKPRIRRDLEVPMETSGDDYEFGM